MKAAAAAPMALPRAGAAAAERRLLVTAAALAAIVFVGAAWLPAASGLEFNGSLPNSYARYAKWNACPSEDAAVQFSFSTMQEDCLLLYADDGGKTDFLLLQLSDGKLNVQINLVSPPAVTTASFGGELNDNLTHDVRIVRDRMATRVFVDSVEVTTKMLVSYGSDFYFGEPGSASDVWLGGVPGASDGRRLTLPAARDLTGFTGKMWNVLYKNCSCQMVNAPVAEIGDGVASTSREVCHGAASSAGFGCVCTSPKYDRDCSCTTYCLLGLHDRCPDSGRLHYWLGFDTILEGKVDNTQGLDARVVGSPTSLNKAPIGRALKVDGSTYAEVSGPSQRDECFGDLDLCAEGYSIAFWLAFSGNSPLTDGPLLSNGGDSSYGIAVQWQANKTIVTFAKKSGVYWQVETDAIWPLPDYWYHVAASWRAPSGGLDLYVNGFLVASQAVSQQRAPAKADRQPFVIGRRGGAAGFAMSIDELHFFNRYVNRSEVVQLAITHYHLDMGPEEGSSSSRSGRLEAFPLPADTRGSGARAEGTYEFVPGRAGEALRLQAGRGGYVSWDEPTMDGACLSVDLSSSSFGTYVSFFVLFEQLDDGLVLLAVDGVGAGGLVVSYRRGTLVAEVGAARLVSSAGPLATGRWYFIELSYGSREAKLMIDRVVVASGTAGVAAASAPATNTLGLRQGRQLLIGRAAGSAAGSGVFTIDYLDIYCADKQTLTDLNLIPSGRPPFLYVSMDEDAPVVLSKDFTRRPNPLQLPSQGELVPGKSLRALKLNGQQGQHVALVARRSSTTDCLTNLERCPHGITVAAWFDVASVAAGTAGLLSTGWNGLSLEVDGRSLRAVADTSFRRWTAEAPVPQEGRWHYVEATFHPKLGLDLYVNKVKVGSTDTYRARPTASLANTADFVIGRSNDVQVTLTPMLVDELEVWLGHRDYLLAHEYFLRSRPESYHIPFDSKSGQRISHDFLTIMSTGSLVQGLAGSALKLSQAAREFAEVTQVKRSPPASTCFGNLTLCSNGFLLSTWIKFDNLPADGSRVSFLSSGTNGVSLYYKDGRVYAAVTKRDIHKEELRTLVWQVSTEDLRKKPLFDSSYWQQVDISWHPEFGLSFFINNKLVGRQGTTTENSPSSGTLDSRFYIGRANEGDSRDGSPTFTADARYDEFEVWYAPREYLVSHGYIIRGRVPFDSFSFERKLRGNVVEHPKFLVTVQNGADLVEGLVGNSSSLSGGGQQYVDLGQHSTTASCLANLEACDNGLTVSFLLSPSTLPASLRNNQYVLSGDAYDVYIRDGRLHAKFRTAKGEWSVSSYPLDSLLATSRAQEDGTKWFTVDLSWHPQRGLSMYLNDELQEQQSTAGPATGPLPASGSLYVGRAVGTMADKNYYAGSFDELKFWYAPRETLVVYGLLPRAAIGNEIVDMNRIQENRVFDLTRNITVYNSPVVVKGPLADNAIHLVGNQYIDMGPGLTCQYNTSACGNGFMLRTIVNPQTLRPNSYLVSSTPVEVYYRNNRLYASYRTPSGTWTTSTDDFRPNEWATLDLSWDEENGLTLYKNGDQKAWQQKANDPSFRFDSTDPFLIGKSVLPGLQQNNDFIVDDVEVWDGKREYLLFYKLISDGKLSKKHDVLYPNNSNGYLRLIGAALPPKWKQVNDVTEELTIDLTIVDREGLIWYNEDADGNKTYLVHKDGQVQFVYDDRTIKRDISAPGVRINDNKQHRIMLQRDGNKVNLFVDDKLRGSGSLPRRLNLLGNMAFVGGSRRVSLNTDGLVSSSIKGRISNVIINGNRFTEPLDLLDRIWTAPFPGFVRVQKDTGFEPELPDRAIYDIDSSAITVLGKGVSVKLPNWELQGAKPSIEITFLPFDTDGILLFGRLSSAGDQYIVAELSDGALYAVADVGIARNSGGVERRDTNGRAPDRRLLAANVMDGKPHTAKFVIDTDAQLLRSFYDGEERPSISLGSGGTRSLMPAVSELYVAGLPSSIAAPWYVWSSDGKQTFVGCIEEVLVNALPSDLQLHASVSVPQAGAIANMCLPRGSMCTPQTCRNGGRCIGGIDRVCDCSDTDYYDESCSTLSLTSNFNGSRYQDIILPREVTSHTDDLSVRFTTPGSSGVLVMTKAERSNEYYKLSLTGEGNLMFETNLGPRVSSARVPGRFNDYNWHTAHIRRRADKVFVSVDDMAPVEINLGGRDYRMKVKEMRLGAETPNPGPQPWFVGSLRNLIYNGVSYGDQLPDPTPLPQPTQAITFRSPETFISLATASEEMMRDFRLTFLFKTKQPTSLMLYQPGENGQYFAVVLQDGRLAVLYQFGSSNGATSLPSGRLDDDQWHRVDVVRLDNRRMRFAVDDVGVTGSRASEAVIAGGDMFRHYGPLYVGGIQTAMQYDLPTAVATRSAGGTGYKGCMATFIRRQRVVDLLREGYQPDTELKRQLLNGCVSGPACREADCLNGAKCSDEGCDCAHTTYTGEKCDEFDVGFRFNVDNKAPGVITFTSQPPANTQRDELSLGFMSCQPSGILTRIGGVSSNEYIELRLDGGHVMAEYSLGSGSPMQLRTKLNSYADAAYHTVVFSRNGVQAQLTVDRKDSTSATGTGDSILHGANSISIGGRPSGSSNVANPFSGIIAGYNYNGDRVLRLAEAADARTTWPVGSVEPASRPFNPRCTPVAAHCSADGDCKNFGICVNGRCDCQLTSWASDPTCTKEDFGLYYGYVNDLGVTVYEFPTPVTTDADVLSLGFMTYQPSGTIFRAESNDGKLYYNVALKNGYLTLDYDLGSGPRTFVENKRVVNDGKYHVLRFNRTDGRLRFFVDELQSEHTDQSISGMRFHDLKYLMAGGVYNKQTDRITENFNGIVSGLQYNGFRFLPLIATQDPGFYRKGDVRVADHPFKLNFIPPPPAHCDENTPCSNGGRCIQKLYCDCRYTGFVGPYCQDYDYGFLHKEYGGSSVLTYTQPAASAVTTVTDQLSVGFQTPWVGGTTPVDILRVESEDRRNYIAVQLGPDGFLTVRHNLGGREVSERFTEFNAANNKYHVLQLLRNGNTGWIKLDNYNRTVSFPDANRFRMKYIYAGGNRDLSHGFYGIVSGVEYNGINLVDRVKAGDEKTISITGKDEDFRLVPWPWPDLRGPKFEPFVPVLSEPGGAGGVISHVGTGGGQPGGGPRTETLTAGGSTVPIGAVVGGIMGALLLTSSIIWAAFGCKPGWLSFTGLGGKAASYAPVATADGAGASAFPLEMKSGNGRAVSVYDTALGLSEDDVDAMAGHSLLAGGGGGAASMGFSNGGAAGDMTGALVSSGGGRQAAYAGSEVSSSIAGGSVVVARGLQSSIGAGHGGFGMYGGGGAGGYTSASYAGSVHEGFTGGGGGGAQNGIGVRSVADGGGYSGSGAATLSNGAGGGGGYNTTTSYSSYQQTSNVNSMLNRAGAAGAAGSGGAGMGSNGGAGYAGSLAGSVHGGSVYGFGTVTNPDQPFITLSEDVQVDRCVLTADGRYVVTGSAAGPPQVWSTQNGDMVTTMAGDSYGSTGLQLCCGERYLAGETPAEQATIDVNEAQAGNRVRMNKLAVWDFATGAQLPIGDGIFCTASCKTNDGNRLVIAKTDRFGGSTTVTVFDVPSNRVLQQISYDTAVGVADSAACVFVSPDDRFVAVGFTNSFDNNANFAIFDLDVCPPSVTDVPIVALNADPRCTVMLDNGEAVTGTRNGELTIWSLKAGKAQRQLSGGYVSGPSRGQMPAAHTKAVNEVVASRDRKYLASASADGTAKIWSLSDEQLLQTVAADSSGDEACSVDISSDNSLAVTGSRDGFIRLWRVRTGQPVAAFNAAMDVFSVRFSDDHRTVVALGDKHGARKLIMLQVVSQKRWRK